MGVFETSTLEKIEPNTETCVEDIDLAYSFLEALKESNSPTIDRNTESKKRLAAWCDDNMSHLASVNLDTPEKEHTLPIKNKILTGISRETAVELSNSPGASM